MTPDAPLLPTWGFFLGPDKAGSTWLHAALDEHPDVFVPAVKDLFFFDRYHARGLPWYEAFFAAAPPASTRVEVCHDYLFSATAADRLHEFAPDARLLVGLRHPLDRARSSYLYMRRQGRVRSSFTEALETVDELIDHGRYGAHLDAWAARFGRERITLLDFEVLRANPQRFFDSACDGLGIARHTLSEESQSVVRGAAEARSQAVATAARRAAVAMRRLRLERVLAPLKASPWIERTLFRPSQSDAVEITQRDWEFAAGRLREDTRRLVDAFGPVAGSDAWWSDDQRRRMTASN